MYMHHFSLQELHERGLVTLVWGDEPHIQGDDHGHGDDDRDREITVIVDSGWAICPRPLRVPFPVILSAKKTTTMLKNIPTERDAPWAPRSSRLRFSRDHR